MAMSSGEHRRRVSVVIPLHNKGAYVAQTLRSLQEQTLADWDVTVVENHSADDGPKIVEEIAKSDDRVRLIVAPESVKGPSAARQLGLNGSRGEFVLFLDADDVLECDHLQSLVDLAESSGADVAVSDCLQVRADRERPQIIDRDGGQVIVTSLSDGGRLGVQEGSIAFAPWPLHCGLIRRELLSENCWPVELDRFASEDSAFWFRLLMGRKIAFTNRCTAIYRAATANARDCVHDVQRWSAAMDRLVESNVAYLQRSGLEPTAGQCESICRLWESVGNRALDAGDRAQAGTAFERAELWLAKCIALGGGGGAALAVRNFLGIRRVNRLKRFKGLVRSPLKFLSGRDRTGEGR